MDIDKVVDLILAEIKKNDIQDLEDKLEIPTGISNRHIHLSKEHIDIIFGTEAKLTPMKDLSQPGQFACEECVTLVGPKGCIEKVRVLGPERSKTQVEILASDCFKLGIKAPLRVSGNLNNTPGLSVVGSKGCVHLAEGVIVAQRHIHMTKKDAVKFDVKDNEIVTVEFEEQRGGRFNNVIIRVTDTSKLDFHIDIDEANSFLIKDKDKVRIIKNKNLI